MKKILITLILIGVIFTIGCKKPKNAPNLDFSENIGDGVGDFYYTNNYALNNIAAQVEVKDAINKDSLNYEQFFINVNLEGALITENNYEYKGGGGYPLHTMEQKYFVNHISSIEVITDVIYNKNIDSTYVLPENAYKIYFKNKYKTYYLNENYKGRELGYSPLRIELVEPLNSSGWYSFKIEITDDNNNVFVAETNSAYIQK